MTLLPGNLFYAMDEISDTSTGTGTSSKRLIIVEDDHLLRQDMVEYLTLAGYDVTGVGSAADFYHEVRTHRYVLAILDVGLPDQSGLVLAEYLRKNSSLRIIMLTALSSSDDKFAGYRSGIDIYMTKPVDCRELAASIGNLIERLTDTLPPPAPASSSWKLFRSTWELQTPAGDTISLTAKEFEFINCLVAPNQQTTVQRQDALKALGYQLNEYGNRSLEALVHRLRQKVEALNCPFPVKTSRGIGYSFTADLVIE